MTVEKCRGSCLCGAVQFEVAQPFSRFYICHCRRCRKITGTANAANLFAPSNSIDWLQGQDKVTLFVLSPKTYFNVAFCAICGSPLPRKARSGDFLIVPAGGLDEDPGLLLENQIFWDDRARWVDDAHKSPRFSGYDEPVQG